MQKIRSHISLRASLQYVRRKDAFEKDDASDDKETYPEFVDKHYKKDEDVNDIPEESKPEKLKRVWLRKYKRVF